jgi:predicted DNA-binding transcriptional regulator AlpA
VPQKNTQTVRLTGNGEPRLISKPEVLDRIGVSYVTIWSMMRSGTFPRCRVIGGKSAWIESEVNDWILSRPQRRLKGDKPAKKSVRA